jgi:hypothetical protein
MILASGFAEHVGPRSGASALGYVSNAGVANVVLVLGLAIGARFTLARRGGD